MKYPVTEPFKTMDEVNAYFAQDPLPCLICGKSYKNVALHVVYTHDMTTDEYRERFGIPWTRGLVCQSTKQNYSNLLRIKREEGLFPASPPAEQVKKLRDYNKKRRPIAACVSNSQSQLALKAHGRDAKLALSDYEEFLGRVATGRTLSEVGSDKDMMFRETFVKYCKNNPDFNKRFETVWASVPYHVQVKGQRVSDSMKIELLRLREIEGLTWPEVAKRMGLIEGTPRSIYFRLRKKGKIDHYRRLLSKS